MNGLTLSLENLHRSDSDIQPSEEMLPSKVLFFKPLPDDITEEILIEAVKEFGGVSNTMIMRRILKPNQALVQFNDVQDAIRMVEHCKKQNFHVKTEYEHQKELPIKVDYSKSQAIHSPKSHTPKHAMTPKFSRAISMSPRAGEMTDHRILLITVQDPQFPITTEVLHKVFSPYGIVEKIVIFLKSIGLQALIQFDTPFSSNAARKSLNGQCIYNDCCRLLISYSKLEDLTVNENSQRSYNFLDLDLPAPAVDLPVDPLQDDSMIRRQRGMSAAVPPPIPDDGSAIRTRTSRTISLPAPMVSKSSSNYSDSILTQPIEEENRNATAGSPVLLFCNLSENARCDNLFNLVSCYGNVLRIKKLQTKAGHALVQMESYEVALVVMSHLRGFRLFHRTLDIRQSKHWYIAVHRRGSVDHDNIDASDNDSFKEYSHSHNRFIGRFANTTKYIHSPTRKLHVSNLTANVDEHVIEDHLRKFNINFNIPIKMFRNNNGHTQAFIQFRDTDSATDLLALAHNSRLDGKSIKIAFSINTSSSRSASISN